MLPDGNGSFIQFNGGSERTVEGSNAAMEGPVPLVSCDPVKGGLKKSGLKSRSHGAWGIKSGYELRPGGIMD